ncbi:MFS transporter [Desulfotruncus alcoholivorax]|uniref:MFS transporter n=1 Tax=Desulfotruncus alcoholivorax TaxID=265477 RepID=UPI00040EAC42|nr:MFS transporter [Desulfotruncus alcoholivorax]
MSPLLVLGVLEFIRGALVFSLLPLYGQYGVGFSLSLISTAISLHYLMDNVFRIPAGWVTDRFGGKWLMVGGIVLALAGLYLLQHSTGGHLFIFGAVLLGLGYTPVWPAVVAETVANMPQQKTSEALGKVILAWLAGAGLGPVLINFVIERSYQWAFICMYALLGLALLLSAWEKKPAVELTEETWRAHLTGLRQEVASVKILFPGLLAQTVALGILAPVITIYARTVWELSPQQISYYLVVVGVITVLLLLPAGKIADSLGFKGPLLGGLLLAAVALVLLPAQRAITGAVAAGALLGLAYAFILPAWNGLQARMVAQGKQGTMWAIFMTLEGVGTAVGAFIGGKAYEQAGHHLPFWISAILLLTMALFYHFLNIPQPLNDAAEGGA